MHIAEIIITLLFALAFILLGLFNPAHMDIDLFGLKSLSLPSALLTFSFFLLGAAYVALWTLFDRFKKQLTVNRLKGRVKELEEKLMNKEQSPERSPCEQGSQSDIQKNQEAAVPPKVGPSPNGAGIDATEDETAGLEIQESQLQESEYIKEAK